MNLRITNVIAAGTMVSVLFFAASCFNSPSSSSSGNSSNTIETTGKLVVMQSGSYPSQTIGDSLLIITPTTDVITEKDTCAGNTLVHVSDTALKAGVNDTTRYKIVGDSLFIDDTLATLGSGAVVVKGECFTRTGSGSGLVGTWTAADPLNGLETYAVISGTLTPAEKNTLDSTYAPQTVAINSFQSGVYNITVGATSSSDSLVDSLDFVGMTLAEFTAETSSIAMSVSRPSVNTIRYIGNKDHDTITQKFESVQGANYTITYTSTLPANIEYVYYSNPSACPDAFLPPWFTSFGTANAKLHGTAKATAMSLWPQHKPINLPKAPWFR